MRSAFTRAVLCLGLLACAGCNFNLAKPCKVDPECGEGGFCDEASGTCHYFPPPPMVRWEAPADNARVRTDVRLMVSVDAGTSRVALPAELPYSVQPGDGGGTLFQDGGVYEGTWTTGGAEGKYTLVAYLRNGLPDGGTVYSKPLRLTVDRTPPVLTVSVPVPARPDGGSTTIHVDPAGDPAAYHRDEIAPVRVTSTADDVDLASLAVTVTGLRDGGAPATTLTGMSACDGGSGFCGTVPLDLWRPELQAFRGSFLVEVRGADLAGNVADAARVSVPVTRWKWSFDAGSVAYLKATPAIGHEGTIYVGTAAGSVSNLYAINPDGTRKWSATVGSVQASPAVGAWDGGNETVYVAGGSTIYAMNGADGGSIDSYTLTSAATNGALCLANVPSSAPLESVVAVVNRATNATLVAFQPGEAPNATSLDNQPALDFPMGVVTNGARFSWGSSTRLYHYGFDGGTWTTASPGPVPLPSHVRGLTLAADRLIGTIGTFGEGALFDVSASDGGVRLYPDNPATAHPAWGLALARDSKVIYSDGAPRLVMFDLASQSPSVSTPMATAILTAPVVGADNMVYTVAYDGTVNARTPDLALDWALTLPGTVESSPNLDCSRDSSGIKQPGRPGVLYVGGNNGQLYAIVVDSRGIDTQAAWPKYQHDPRNTGNSTTDLSEFACP